MWAVEPGGENSDTYNCDEVYLTIKVDMTTRTYTGTFLGDEPIKARILDVGEQWFSIQYEGEERLMDNGELQIWYLILIEADKFVWVREDWITDDGVRGSTEPRKRCPVEVS